MMATVSPDLQHTHVEGEDNVQTHTKPVSCRQFVLMDFHRPDDDEGLRDDMFWSGILCFVWLMLIVVVTAVYVKTWPAATDKYTSDNAVPKKGYHCDCSLPLNLQEPEVPSASSVNMTMNFNQCYPRSSLEDISVIQYLTNNTGIDEYVRQSATEDVHYKTLTGYVVRQEALELTFKDGQKLGHLYRNDVIDPVDEDILYERSALISTSFLNFPPGYIRMGFRYNCSDCNLCGLGRMEENIYNTTRGQESWVSCYYYGRQDQQQCSATVPEGESRTYEGKCIMYPTRALPFTFAIKRFMRSVNDTPGIGGIRPIPAHWGSVDGFGEYISLQSNVIYLNRSHVTEGNLRYGFVEFPKGSTIRAWFLTKFPGSDTSCTAVPSLQNTSSVCNGTSVCNAFMKDDKGIQLKCDDMQDEVACKELVQQADLTVDNAYGNRNDVGDQQICSSPRFSCISGDTVVPAYRVTRFATVNNSADPINAFLNYSRLWNDWAAMAGTCTNTYKQVYRYKKGNDTHLLEAECTNGTDVCKLTGRYHRLDEIHQSSSNEELMLSRETFYNDSAKGGLFVCYRVKQQGWGLWFLNYVNQLFSWMRVLIFVYVSGLYKLVRFLNKSMPMASTGPLG